MLARTWRTLWPLVRTHWTALALLLLGILGPLVLVAKLTEDVFRDGGFGWDREVLRWYAAHRTPELTWLAEALALLGGVRVLPLVTAVVALGLARAGARIHAWFLAAAVLGATLLNGAAKLTFQRPRPEDLGALLLEPGYSFPSGHAMSNAAFGLALALLFWRSRAGWPAALFGLGWAVLVGVSRNYLGVHYPTDVLVGWLSSLAWVVGLYLWMSRRWPALRGPPGDRPDTSSPQPVPEAQTPFRAKKSSE